MNILNVTELYTQKWSILYYVYFITIKRKSLRPNISRLKKFKSLLYVFFFCIIHFPSLNLIAYTKVGIWGIMLYKAGNWIKWKLWDSSVPTGIECVLSPEGLLKAGGGRGEGWSSSLLGCLRCPCTSKATSTSVNQVEDFGKGDHMYSPQNREQKGKHSSGGKCAVNWLHICHKETQVNFSWITDFSKR